MQALCIHKHVRRLSRIFYFVPGKRFAILGGEYLGRSKYFERMG